MNCKKAAPPPHNASFQCDGIWVLFSPVPPGSDGFRLHSITVYSTHRSAEPFHPARVTRMTRERERRGEKNGRMCLCQGLMRRAMPWIACSMGPPRSLGDVWRGSASHWQETTQLHNISWSPPSFLHFFQSTAYSLFFFPLLQEHIFKLMKSDSYARFLRSNIYQDLLLARKKVSCTLWPPQHWFLTKTIGCVYWSRSRIPVFKINNWWGVQSCRSWFFCEIHYWSNLCIKISTYISWVIIILLILICNKAYKPEIILSTNNVNNGWNTSIDCPIELMTSQKLRKRRAPLTGSTVVRSVLCNSNLCTLQILSVHTELSKGGA